MGQSGVERIEGGHDHPVTSGFICGKVRRYGRRLIHEDRLLHPMRRVGEKGSREFARVSWDEAIGEITEQFARIKEEWGGKRSCPTTTAVQMGC